MKLAIVIPAYNEEKMIGSVLRSLPRRLDGIKSVRSIVVDDGSMDRTYHVARRHSDVVLRHVVNLGLGGAITTGLEAAKELGSDIAVTLDADGQHNPLDVARLIAPIQQQEADVVIGTRMTDTKGMPAMKVFGNWVMNFLTLVVFQQWTTDSQSGMRAFSKGALEVMKFYSTGYEISSEIIGEIRRNSLVLKELPIETIYSRYSNIKGQSWLNGVNVLTKMISIKMMGKK